MTDNAATDVPSGHDWRQAGEAWGHRANDWACLYEHYSLDVQLAMWQSLQVGAGTRLLDVACGSGLGVRLEVAMGAEVAAIDAAEELVAVARLRAPTADIRLGSMFDLPWPDGSFDAVISVNGIWGGCEVALDEIRRVLRPGGRLAFSFWGVGRPLHLRDVFKVFALHAPREHLGSMVRLNQIGAPGVAETMLAAAGFEVVEVGSRISMIEWPDDDTAWRALSSVGPAVPALRHADSAGVGAALRADVLAAIEPTRDERGIYRLLNDHRFVVAQAPL